MAAATTPQRAMLTEVAAAALVLAGLLDAAGAAEDEPEPEPDEPDEPEDTGELEDPAEPAEAVELPGGR